MEIAVMISGDRELCVRRKTGTKIDPPNNNTKKLSIAVLQYPAI
jgi:hypothetical protein